MSSYSTVQQEDSSIQLSGDAENILAAGSTQQTSNPYSIIANPDSVIGDVMFNEYPDSLADTVNNLVSTFGSTISNVVNKSSETQNAANAALSSAVSERNLGDTSVVPKIALYVTIGVVVVVVGRAVIK